MLSGCQNDHTSRTCCIFQKKSFKNKYSSIASKQRSPPLFHSPASPALSWLSLATSLLLYVHSLLLGLLISNLSLSGPFSSLQSGMTFLQDRCGHVTFLLETESSLLSPGQLWNSAHGFPGLCACPLSCHLPRLHSLRTSQAHQAVSWLPDIMLFQGFSSVPFPASAPLAWWSSIPALALVQIFPSHMNWLK